MRGAAMSLTAAASGFVVFLLFVQVIQGDTPWGVTYSSTQICAVKGSTVDIHCTYTYPSTVTNVTETFWHLIEPILDLKTLSEYKDRVQYYCGNKNSNLRISDLRERDSVVYKFRFITNQEGGKWSGEPGVKLSVTALQMRVNKVTFNQSGTVAELSCSSSCTEPSYVWIKNGQKVPEEASSYTAYLNPGDSISCALKGHEIYHTPLLYAPNVPSVSVSPSGEIMEGSSVTLNCSRDANIVANYTWYKESPDQNEKPPSKGPQLVFISIQSSDSGQYYCTAENQLGRRRSEYILINVKYGPKTSSVSVSPSAEIVEGSSVTLTCSSDANPAANYTWYKENQTFAQGPGGIHLFLAISSEDRGNYYCKSENQYGRNNSTSLFIDVLYAPKLPSVSVSPSAEIVENSSVTLTCSSDANPASNYTWYKENQTLLQGPEGIYHFTSISSKDSGTYYCKSENRHGRTNSTSRFIDVQYAPKTSSLSVSPSAEKVEGSSVTLTCSSDANPAANYTWYKENQTLLQGPEGVYHFTSISSKDTGNYYCKSENQHGRVNSSSLFIDVQYAPKLPSVSVCPYGKIAEGSSVTLTCSSDANPEAKYTWYKENEDSPKASGQIFIITNFRAEHSGNYYCEAQNRRGRQNSTLHLAGRAGEWILITAGTVTAILIVVILIAVLIGIRKKRARKQPSEPTERPDRRAQKQPAEPKDNLHYASVHFSKKQADPLYSNTITALAQKPRREEEVDRVEYSTIKLNSGSTAPGNSSQETEVDPAALYSTVNNFPLKHGYQNS